MGIVLLQEMQEVEQMLEFVAKRLNDAENVNWKGMFKKNPLWWYYSEYIVWEEFWAECLRVNRNT